MIRTLYCVKILSILISPIARANLREVANFTLGENFLYKKVLQWHVLAKLAKNTVYNKFVLDNECTLKHSFLSLSKVASEYYKWLSTVCHDYVYMCV